MCLLRRAGSRKVLDRICGRKVAAKLVLNNPPPQLRGHHPCADALACVLELGVFSAMMMMMMQDNPCVGQTQPLLPPKLRPTIHQHFWSWWAMTIHVARLTKYESNDKSQCPKDTKRKIHVAAQACTRTVLIINPRDCLKEAGGSSDPEA